MPAGKAETEVSAGPALTRISVGAFPHQAVLGSLEGNRKYHAPTALPTRNTTVRDRGLGRYAVKDDSDHSKLHLDKVVERYKVTRRSPWSHSQASKPFRPSPLNFTPITHITMTSYPPRKCCFQGVKHDGDATGDFITIDDFEVYKKAPEGAAPEKAIILSVPPHCIGSN